MRFLFQVRHNQTLPVPVQNIFTAVGCKLHPASRLSRFQQKMNLRIMPKRLKMPYSFHSVRDCFLIDDLSGPKIHRYMEPLPDNRFQNFCLNFPHKLRLNLLQFLFPSNMQLRFLFLQKAEFCQHLPCIRIFGKFNLISQHRLQYRQFRICLHSHTGAGARRGQSCHGTDHSCFRLFHRPVLRPGIDSDLIDFFLPAALLFSSWQRHFHFQNTACYFHPGQTLSLIIPADLKDSGAKNISILRAVHILFHSLQQLVRPCFLQCRTEITGKNTASGNQAAEFFIGHGSVL